MKKLLLVLLLFSPQAYGQIAFQSVTTQWFDQGSTNKNLASVTVGAGADRLMIVVLNLSTGGGTSTTNCAFDTAGTNQSLTDLGDALDGNVGRVEIWQLKSPTVTTSNVSCNANSDPQTIMSVMIFTGVDQVTTNRGALGTSVTAADPSTIAFTTVANDWIVGGILVDGSCDVQTPEVARYSDVQLFGSGYACGSTRLASGTSTTYTFNLDVGPTYTVMAGTVLIPAATAGAYARLLGIIGK